LKYRLDIKKNNINDYSNVKLGCQRLDPTKREIWPILVRNCSTKYPYIPNRFKWTDIQRNASEIKPENKGNLPLLENSVSMIKT